MQHQDRLQSSTDSNAKPKAGGTLNVGLNAETDGWNPTSSEWAGAAYQAGQTFFDPLVAFDDRQDYPLRPWPSP